MKTLFNGRAQFDSSSGFTKITIPVKKHYFSIFGAVFTLLILILAGTFLVYVEDLVVENSVNFLFAFYMLFLILIFSFMSFLLFYNTLGSEKIVIQPNKISSSRNLFGIEFSYKDYLAEHLSNFRFNDISHVKNPYERNTLYIWGLGDGHIKFDYGAKTPTFAFGLDEAESKYVVKFIKDTMKII